MASHALIFYVRSEEPLLYRVGFTRELALLPLELPESLRDEIFTGLVVLECEYGEARDYLESGGYSVIAETVEDVRELKGIVDYDIHPPEWATRIGNTGYASALFIMNDDFSLMVYLPEAVAPEAIKEELEE